MKSVKPGRGPSLLSAIAGLGAAVFGIIWIIAALKMGAPIFMALFGIVFVVIAVAGVVYNAHNAAAENRYSEFDITDGDEEPDPLSLRFSNRERPASETPRAGSAFCPYCGAAIREDFVYCPRCGRKLQ